MIIKKFMKAKQAEITLDQLINYIDSKQMKVKIPNLDKVILTQC